MFQEEVISEQNGKNFENEIWGIFRSTSAKENIGIEDLFISLGIKILDKNFVDNEYKKANTGYIETMSDVSVDKIEFKYRKDSLMLNKKAIKKEKKCC